MATYVNLSVNQGLINKAKQVQAANRNSLANKQAAKKKAVKEAKDGPLRKQDGFRARKRAAFSDDLTYGTFRMKTDTAPGESYYERRSMANYIWRTIEAPPLGQQPHHTEPFLLDFATTRTFLSGNGGSSIDDPECLNATTDPILGQRRADLRQQYPGIQVVHYGQVLHNQLVFPVGDDKAIVVANTASDSRFIVTGITDQTTQRIGQIGFVVSSVGIRRLAQLPPTIAGPFGPQEAAAFAYRQRPPNPAPRLFSPSIYIDNTGLRSSVEPLLYNAWDTTDGEMFRGDNPWLWHTFSNQDINTRAPLVGGISHPEERYSLLPQVSTIPGESDIFPGYVRLWGESSGFPLAQNRAIPVTYTDAAQSDPYYYGVSAPVGDNSETIFTFWDWGAPEYCRAEALAMGFTEDDLEP